MVETGGSGETEEGHSRIYFDGVKAAASTGIRQVWRDQVKVGRGEHI